MHVTATEDQAMRASSTESRTQHPTTVQVGAQREPQQAAMCRRGPAVDPSGPMGATAVPPGSTRPEARRMTPGAAKLRLYCPGLTGELMRNGTGQICTLTATE